MIPRKQVPSSQSIARPRKIGLPFLDSPLLRSLGTVIAVGCISPGHRGIIECSIRDVASKTRHPGLGDIPATYWWDGEVLLVMSEDTFHRAWKFLAFA